MVNLSAASLFELYKAEKNDSDPLVYFPTFKEWKVDYATEQQHEMDTTTLDDIPFVDLPEEYKDNKDSVAPTPPKKLVVVKKKKGSSNMDKAKVIYTEMIAEDGTLPARKDVIARFTNELGISKPCASTYEYNVKQKRLG